MKLTVDSDNETVTYESSGERVEVGLYTAEAFNLISRQWINVGWNQKYSYTFTWMGRPIIQLPEDMVRMQEVIYQVKPDVIVETGIAHGGSLVFYASLCKAMGRGRVVGVDIEIRPHNRKAIEAHELSHLITLIEGGSTAPEIVDQVRAGIAANETVLVILDSNHTRAHVLAELESYASLVTKNSYLVTTDGGMKDWYSLPNGKPEWREDNPVTAALEFVLDNQDFVIEEPAFAFNEGAINERVTYWPSAFVKRVR